MPTKQQVKDAINKIIDRGNNTANTVRSVLNDIVDYAEPTNNTSEIKSFSNIINNGNYILSYSIKGFEKEFINFTFHIECIEQTIKEYKGSISFQIDKELFEFLAPILPNSKVKINHPGYVLHVSNRDAKKESMLIERLGITFKTISVILALDEKNQSINFMLVCQTPKTSPLEPTDFISTSIAIHHLNNR